MQCYVCETNITNFCTSCCYHTCCKKCAEDIGIDCHCYQTFDRLVICEKTPNDTLTKCEHSLIQAKQKWSDWIKSIEGAVWKLPISLEEYKNAFKKSEILYQERLDAIKQLNSCSYYLSNIPLFEFNLPEHKFIKNKKGKKVVISKKFQEFFEKNIDKLWDWRLLSNNPNITMEIVEKYPNKPWDWIGLSGNPNITIEFVEKYPDKPWNWGGLSRNPNITMEFLKNI